MTCPGVDVGGVDNLFTLSLAEVCPGIDVGGREWRTAEAFLGDDA